MRASLFLLLLLVAACGARGEESDDGPLTRPDGVGGSGGTCDRDPGMRIPGWPRLEPRLPGGEPGCEPECDPGCEPECQPGCEPDCEVPEPIWQPGFHQALRWEQVVTAPTTYRQKLPIGRSGEELQLAFRSGDGEARLHRATIAHADSGGRLASDPIALTFDGESGFRAGPRERVVSDPLPFDVQQGDELYVSFEAEGHLAAGAIELFPDSYAAQGADPADHQIDDWPQRQAVGLASILVLGPPTPAVVALGDSITEAFVDGKDDYRRNWPHLAEMELEVPIANAAVSGQGLWGALYFLDDEVLVLPGVTDCVVLLGTNDLGAVDEHELTDDLEELFDDLDGFCRVWAGTLPPKDRPDVGEEILHVRREVNRWIREEADVAGVIDFATLLAHPDDPERWAPGLDEDGIHPSVAGQAVMAEEAVRVLSEGLERD